VKSIPRKLSALIQKYTVISERISKKSKLEGGGGKKILNSNQNRQSPLLKPRKCSRVKLEIKVDRISISYQEGRILKKERVSSICIQG